MDRSNGIQDAISYIEEHLTDEIDYELAAKQCFSSSYHFQRVFSILCGYTLGEYIRNRRLSLSGAELQSTDAKVIDIALKYGYESPDSFAKAFRKFHGVTPSQARGGARLRSFSRLSVKISLEGGSQMEHTIKEFPQMVLTGYKRRFKGVPFGAQRSQQENEMFVGTRAAQWLLRGASHDSATDYYCIVTNVDDDGYDFYIAVPLDDWERENLYNQDITGIDFMERFCFENVTIPANTYVVFETERKNLPQDDYTDIRQRLVAEWFPGSGYKFADAPELALIHWRSENDRNGHYVEIRIPIEKSR